MEWKIGLVFVENHSSSFYYVWPFRRNILAMCVYGRNSWSGFYHLGEIIKVIVVVLIHYEVIESLYRIEEVRII